MIVDKQVMDVKSIGVGSATAMMVADNSQLFNIMSSNIYTHKLAAPFTEICSNAYDAHVAAGISEKPFDVTLPNDLDSNLTIRDYGNGLSLEDMIGNIVQVKYINDNGVEEIKEEYQHGILNTYFFSTKTDSNNFIGAKGLGFKSPLAYTDSYTVKSHHNGTTHVCIVFYDNERKPQFNYVGSNETTAPNGLEVIIPIDRKDFKELTEIASKVLLFYKVKPNINTTLLYDNAITNVRKNLFQIRMDSDYGKSSSYFRLPTSLSEQSEGKNRIFYPALSFYILHGSTGYQVESRVNQFDKERIKRISNIIRDEYGVDDVSAIIEVLAESKYIISNNHDYDKLLPLVEVNIGELDMTASREALDMTAKTTKTINDCIDIILANELYDLHSTKTNIEKIVNDIMDLPPKDAIAYVRGNKQTIINSVDPTSIVNKSYKDNTSRRREVGIELIEKLMKETKFKYIDHHHFDIANKLITYLLKKYYSTRSEYGGENNTIPYISSKKNVNIIVFSIDGNLAGNKANYVNIVESTSAKPIRKYKGLSISCYGREVTNLPYHERDTHYKFSIQPNRENGVSLVFVSKNRLNRNQAVSIFRERVYHAMHNNLPTITNGFFLEDSENHGFYDELEFLNYDSVELYNLDKIDIKEEIKKYTVKPEVEKTNTTKTTRSVASLVYEDGKYKKNATPTKKILVLYALIKGSERIIKDSDDVSASSFITNVNKVFGANALDDYSVVIGNTIVLSKYKNEQNLLCHVADKFNSMLTDYQYRFIKSNYRNVDNMYYNLNDHRLELYDYQFKRKILEDNELVENEVFKTRQNVFNTMSLFLLCSIIEKSIEYIGSNTYFSDDLMEFLNGSKNNTNGYFLLFKTLSKTEYPSKQKFISRSTNHVVSVEDEICDGLVKMYKEHKSLYVLTCLLFKNNHINKPGVIMDNIIKLLK